MQFNYETRYCAWRCTLSTNQYKYGSSIYEPVNFGAYSCTFIGFEFLVSTLTLAKRHWPEAEHQSMRFLRNTIAEVATCAITSGVSNHKIYCMKNRDRLRAEQSKNISAAFDECLGQKNAQGNVRIIFDEGEHRICTADQITLTYSPESKMEKLNIHDASYKEKVSYILGAKNHVVSLVRYKNCWLLFNSLPETRGSLMPVLSYPFFNAYVLCFNGADAMKNLLYYVRHHLWKPSERVAIFPVYLKPLRGIGLNTPLTPQRPGHIDIDPDLSLVSLDEL